jgi:hypothetical protein
MNTLRMLGYANDKPCSLVLDRASPHCRVSSAFLFRNSLHARLNSSGCEFAQLDISVPTQGGYYAASQLTLACSVACDTDIVLGADWLPAPLVVTTTNFIRPPPADLLGIMPDGLVWKGDGTPFVCV